jgi:acetolactate synthase-1/2/3 large subunit
MEGPAVSDGGEAVLQAARDLGADYVFCSSGSEWAPVWEALARADASGVPTPRYLDLTHETLAVAMATGYATVTGRGQLVLLHAAAGLLQGANAIHGALLTGVPLVVCSAESTGYGDAAGPDTMAPFAIGRAQIPQVKASAVVRLADLCCPHDGHARGTGRVRRP